MTDLTLSRSREGTWGGLQKRGTSSPWSAGAQSGKADSCHVTATSLFTKSRRVCRAAFRKLKKIFQRQSGHS